MPRVRYRSRYNRLQDDDCIKHTEKRSKSGCLTCRKRKKKCDELKPRCSGCTRNILQCVWPEHINSHTPATTEESNIFVHVSADEIGKEYSHNTTFKTLRSKFTQWDNMINLSRFSDGTLCQLFDHDCKPLKQFPSCEQLEREHLERQKQITVINNSLKSDLMNIMDTGFDFSKPPEKRLSVNGSHPEATAEHPTKETKHWNYESCAISKELRHCEEGVNRVYEEVKRPEKGDDELFHNPVDLLNDDKWKTFLDLQLEPYHILKESSAELSIFTRRSTPTPSINNNKTPKLPSTTRDRGTESIDLVEHEICASLDTSVGHSNYAFLHDENNIGTIRYRNVFAHCDKGDFTDIEDVASDEAFLLYACVHRFIPNLGPQDTHPMLTTNATFIPQVENNLIMKEIFLCCGAAYLEWYDRARFSRLSDYLYESSEALIKKYLSENGMQGVELWLLASFQLLCLRNKHTFSGSVDKCVNCLSNSYLMIKNTYYVNKSGSDADCAKTEKNIVLPGLQNLTYEIENDFMGDSKLNKLKDELVLQPHERMYIESFIYNYSVAILFATDISRLPNPFSVFKELSHVLKCPIYHCQFEWMNNPVLGSALDAFEILAKASFIARLPMPLDHGSVWYQKAQQLQTMCNFYTSPVLPPQLKAYDSKRYESAKLSSLVGKIVTKSCFLLVSKALHYESFDVRDVSIQKNIRDVFGAFSEIPRENRIWGILAWSLVIMGSFATTFRDRDAVLRYLLNIGERFHLQSTIKIRCFLEKLWQQPEELRLNFLFNRVELSKVVV